MLSRASMRVRRQMKTAPPNHHFRYPLGSRRQWRETLLLLVLPPLIVSALLWMLLRLTGIDLVFSTFGALVCFIAASLVPLLNDSFEKGTEAHWLSDITVSLAYGWAEEDGIHFRKWFRKQFVSWKAISSIEYWPERGGWIDLHLYSERLPVVFIPESPNRRTPAGVAFGASETVEYISWKLNQTWPGHSTFLISFENPHREARGFMARALRNLSLRQKAIANSFIVLLGVILFYTYLAIRIAYRQSWKVVAVILVGLLIVQICLRFSRKSKSTNRQVLDKVGHSKQLG